MFTEDTAKISETVRPIAEKYGQELVDVTITSNSRGPVLRIIVGSKEGPTIGDLTSITKEFKKLADTEGMKMLPPDYQLEVSSPGIDRELREFRDFSWNEGRTLKLSVNSGEKTVNLEGELIKAEAHRIVLKTETEELEIAYKDIQKAKIKIKF
ncbi:MAG: hypothetical protein RBS89_04435 [Candidatus Delongbacteria bacterium]|nr:hypothetical protein [Candidatus Delongbacteria bacterium]